MINTDYSQDLPINTMGRRIRTRLYFTSESHLHTVLNVLRFAHGANGDRPILSNIGTEIINSTPELCYLTHIVMRVFEDSREEMRDDPRRFRVEILFSPGTTATPLHMHEMDRLTDSSRCDTSPLQVIGRECLSCEELETFFGEAIVAGRVDCDEYLEVASMSTMPERMLPSQTKLDKMKATDKSTPKLLASLDTIDVAATATVPISPMKSDPVKASTEVPAANAQSNIQSDKLGQQLPSKFGKAHTSKDAAVDDKTGDVADKEKEDERSEGSKEEGDESVDDRSSDVVKKIIGRKQFWTSVAVGSFVLGACCLLLAMRLTDDSRQRRWSSRRYSR